MIKPLAIAIAITAACLTPGIAFAGTQGQDAKVYPPDVPKSLDASFVTSICVKDAPWVQYVVKTIGFTANPPVAKLTITDINGNPIKVLTNMPLDGPDARFIYPGAAVDKDGNATDWPGWDLVNGKWIELGANEGDTVWRKGLNIRVDVNPTTFTKVSYPDASPICAGPQRQGSSPPAAEPPAAEVPDSAGSLPRTGSDGTDTILQIGAMLLVAGGVVVIATRRRRSSPASG